MVGAIPPPPLINLEKSRYPNHALMLMCIPIFYFRVSCFSCLRYNTSFFILQKSIRNFYTSVENLVRGEHYEPKYKFDSRCSLKVVVDYRASVWNGNIQFLANDKEMLYLELYVARQKLAVRNDVYNSETKYGDTWSKFSLMDDVTYPDVKRLDNREYNLTFGAENFEIQSAGKVNFTFSVGDFILWRYSIKAMSSFRKDMSMAKCFIKLCSI